MFTCVRLIFRDLNSPKELFYRINNPRGLVTSSYSRRTYSRHFVKFFIRFKSVNIGRTHYRWSVHLNPRIFDTRMPPYRRLNHPSTYFFDHTYAHEGNITYEPA